MTTICIYYPESKRIFTKRVDDKRYFVVDRSASELNPDYSTTQMMDIKDFPASKLPEDLCHLGDQTK